MVVGMGTDLAEIVRVARSIERFGDRFLARVYTPGEIAYCMTKKGFAESFAARFAAKERARAERRGERAPTYAKRFAAKEAGAKALGTGISFGVSWKEFEVTRAKSGKPSLVLHGRAAALAAAMGVVHISLSLTHTRDLAMAVVVMEGRDWAPGSRE